MPQQRAVIIGAGPAGLTAALELLERTGFAPLVLEASEHVGGLSRTGHFGDNRIDIGGHRFFTKSDRVLDWWLHVFPLQALPPGPRPPFLARPLASAAEPAPHPERDDQVMLLRQRKSRIYFRGQLFDYPVRLGPGTLRKLGLVRSARISASYLKSTLAPIVPERTLEDLYVNRFGRELYDSFFSAYTEKVLGVPCSAISPEWGRERTRGLTITQALQHAVRRLLPRSLDLSQSAVETSLVEQFLYPKLGPGQFWEEVARRVERLGGEIRLRTPVRRIDYDGSRVLAVHGWDAVSGRTQAYPADLVLSTMPLGELVGALSPAAPDEVLAIARGLRYRGFINVGLLVRKRRPAPTAGKRLALTELDDNWIYIQEPGIRMGRLQIYNNWSPYLVRQTDAVCAGLEYFCSEGDELWSRSDDELVRLGIEELASLDLLDPEQVADHTVVRVAKAYPVYAGAYRRLAEVRSFTDRFDNMILLGRNGMHRYNNQDHSMLTAMCAVDNVLAGVRDRSNLWAVDTES